MSRINAWIEANRPPMPRVPINATIEEYNRQWAIYNVAAREYAAKLAAVTERHADEIRAAFPNGHSFFIDGVASDRRTFEVHERKKGD